MDFKEVFNEEYAWTTFSFYEDGELCGEMNVGLEEDQSYAFIWSICSYKKGVGTKMIHFLRDECGIQSIEGDAAPDSIGFWERFHPIWDEESFEITLKL